MAANSLIVRGAEATYPVTIGTGLLENTLPQFIKEHGFRSVALITNETIAPLYGEALRERIPGSFLISVPDGEKYKNLATVQSIYEHMLFQKASRSTLVVALGGGVVGDMAGFAAATFMRGVPLVQVPTTLLAMVDSSIGGKVGVDLPQGKNLVGSFKDPIAVFADSSTLQTLPQEQFRCGMAEVVKSALVGDPLLLESLEQKGMESIENLITRAAQVKISIVEEDRQESGIRAFLNLGHTFGHALEQVSGYQWLHGEAVAVGLVGASLLSEKMSFAEADLTTRIKNLLKALGLPSYFQGYSPDKIWNAMNHDKKWRNGVASFVLLKKPGQPILCNSVPSDLVISVLSDLQEQG